MKYKVNIKEILSRTVEIEADSLEDANRKVNELYDAEEIVLDFSDWQETIIDEAEEAEE